MSLDPGDPQSDVDPDEVALFAFNVWNFKQGEMVSMMIHIGHRLGLYGHLDGAGPTTSAQLAALTGLDERWLREWLEGQSAAGLLDHDGEAGFKLVPAGAAVLADDHGSLAFAAGAFTAPPSVEATDRIVEAFTTGIGPTWDQKGPAGAH